jgi:tetratricopeptide (TPR) repeat protein
MSLAKTVFRFAGPALAVVAICAMLWSCGPSTSVSGAWKSNDEMDRAVAAFIAGDFDGAAKRLEALADRAQTPEQRREVYWYLGRAYLAAERYDRAIDAFTAGKANGGGVAFDEYLQRLNALVSGEAGNVARSERVTRAQLAVLVNRMFYESPVDTSATAVPGPGGEDGVLENMASVERGVVGLLPDGQFYGEVFVTRGAFFAVVSRLVRDKSIDVDTATLFEGGFAWALAGEDAGNYVTGKEAVAVLRRVAAAQHPYGGPGS